MIVDLRKRTVTLSGLTIAKKHLIIWKKKIDFWFMYPGFWWKEPSYFILWWKPCKNFSSFIITSRLKRSKCYNLFIRIFIWQWKTLFPGIKSVIEHYLCLFKKIYCIYLDVRLQYFVITKLWCIFWIIQILSYHLVWREWFLHNQDYNFLLHSVRSKQNISNFISLHLSDSVNRDKVTVIDTYVNVINSDAINSIDIKRDPAQDPMLTIRNYNWHTLQKTRLIQSLLN